MNKFYCLLLSTVLLSGCFWESNNATMPEVEVATAEDYTAKNAVKKQPKMSAAAEQKILAASKLNAKEISVYAELETFAHAFVIRSNNCFVPCKSKPKIENKNGQVTVSYTEIDHTSINLELLPVKSKYFEYIAKMRYVERNFQSVGKDLHSAMNGQFRVLGSRRVTELPRYVRSRWVE